MNISYPRIDDAALVPLRAVEAQLKKYPDYLDRRECPYSPAIRDFLRSRLGKAEAAPVKRHYDDDDLEAEIAELYSELKKAGFNLTGVDAKEKAQVMKTYADLLTKLVTLRQSVVNIRYMGLFQKAVLEVLETVLTADQRGEFITKMGTYLNADLPVDRAAVLGQGDLGDPASPESEGPGA
jgi:hypothetical protein